MERIQELWGEHKVTIAVVIVCLAVVITMMMAKINAQTTIFDNQGSTSQKELESQSSISSPVSVESSTVTPPSTAGTDKNDHQKIQVDVKGAVIHPGVIKIRADQRVDAVLKQAGGTTKNADLDQVNLAHKLVDQMLIYIPVKGEKTTLKSPVLITQSNADDNLTDSDLASNEINTETDSSEQGVKINLNTATKEQLTQLNGIGDKKADQIIAYRQQNGNFKSIEDLKSVSGIGDKTYAALADQITV